MSEMYNLQYVCFYNNATIINDVFELRVIVSVTERETVVNLGKNKVQNSLSFSQKNCAKACNNLHTAS